MKSNELIIEVAYNLNRFIHKIDQSISVKLSVHFKKENYLIYFNDKKIVKYYDQKIIDQKTSDLIKKVITDVMKTIAKYSDSKN